MVRFVILEGMPFAGKTTIINNINKMNLMYVHTVSELICKQDIQNQDFFYAK